MKGSARRVLLGCICAGGVGLLAIAVVPRGGAVRAGTRVRALSSLRSELARISAPNMPGPGKIGPSVAGTVTKTSSYNWGGYADTSSTVGTFTAVSGSWTVQALTCTSEDRIYSDWVGLDGFSNSTVEQAGVTGQCFQGKAYYYSWYEMYPSGTVVVGNKVKAGDKISASVTRSVSSYTLKVTDSTTSGNNVSTTQTCGTSTCTDESAEWIVERPYYATTGVVPLAQFKPAFSVTAGSETAHGTKGTIATVAPYQMAMIDSTDTYNVSNASALNSGGNAFTDTWLNSY